MTSGSLPFIYVIPVRRRWWGRVQIVEYKGTATTTGTIVVGRRDGISASFNAAGPITRTIHPRRFWLMWSAKRYLERLKAGNRG